MPIYYKPDHVSDNLLADNIADSVSVDVNAYHFADDIPNAPAHNFVPWSR